MAEGETMRLDRFLWFARIAKTRGAAQAIAEKGLLRIDGRRIERSSTPVRVGCILAFPLFGKVRVLRVEALPRRRGPPAEALACYQDLRTENVSQEAPID
ncbi:MAG: RNA-binding S4 domain-containing protein [Sphingomonas sp.]|uniref:RNA-binding S4 domain-containing protein n=1 Tax=Sphingomonas sp. TaxID=28214 RepID=UPI0025F39337|nr:S4 domain-containing protein [Sphingomonas sp.]MBX3563070.1 RNA-binding S4 domain-containing protein [Sphingomonas sp.]